jgi:hypothetical protein
MIPVLMMVCLLTLPAPAQYSGGSGTAEDPYQIATAADLIALGATPDDYDKHFILTADIDLDPNLPGRKVFDDAVIAPSWAAFDGAFDGNGHTISNLTIRGGNYLGLFGDLDQGARVSNLGLEAVDINGHNSVGGLAGRVGDWDRTGGVVVNCYSTGTVSGGAPVGGLAGSNYGGIITASYSTCTVSGGGPVGGLVGSNRYGSITASYSSGSVAGDGNRVGGLVGSNREGSITASYSSGSVNINGGGRRVSGLVGDNDGIVHSSVWDVETSGLSVSDGGVGLTTAEMMDPHVLGLNGFASDPNWTLDAGGDYPRLAWEGTAGEIIPEPVIDWLDGQGTEQEPYRIDTAEQLMLVGKASILWDKHYILGADIDLDPSLPGRRVLRQALIQNFTGVFDGNGHTISHLTIEGVEPLGLFGQLESTAEVKNLGVLDVNMPSSDGCDGFIGAGGLAGRNLGNISMSYSTGTVNGSCGSGGLVGYNGGSITTSHSASMVTGNEVVGGLVGLNHGEITASYSSGAVTGDNSEIGGLVGENHGSIATSYSNSTVTGYGEGVGGLVGSGDGITMSYSSGTVTGGNVFVGGLLGWGGANITMSYWDIEASNQPHMGMSNEDFGLIDPDNSYGKTTAEMKQQSTFEGWDFVGETENGTEDVWKIVEGQTYPLLSWQKYGGGTGEPNDPYLIYTAGHLNALGAEPNDYDKHFKLMADIDLSEYSYDRAVIAPDVNDAEADFQGIGFTGVFDGNGHKISRLTINGGSHVGLFGLIVGEAMISGLGLEEVNIIGTGDCVGGLVGSNIQCFVAKSYSAGTIAGNENVGGLVGSNGWGRIVTSCATGVITGSEHVGGLAGENWGNISTSCSDGTVTGDYAVGGLVGSNRGDTYTIGISNTHSSCAISGEVSVGGLVGENGGKITASYSTGSVMGNEHVGGLVGAASILAGRITVNGETDASFWDMETSGQAVSAGGTGLTTAEMQIAATFLEAGWDFIDETENGTEDIWWIDEGQDYPRLWWEAAEE